MRGFFNNKRLFSRGRAELCCSDFVDIHCHCLSGVDDGPVSFAESLSLCRALADDGIRNVIATPHQLGRYADSNNAKKIRQAVVELNEGLKECEIPLTVSAGGDVRVDERIMDLLESDEILTLADGGKYILLELPHRIFIDIEPLLVELSSRGYCSIVSHPERHPVLSKQHGILSRWIKHSTYLQITAGSLVGDFGGAAKKAAWEMLKSEFVSFVATDSHDLQGRRPRMSGAYSMITEKANIELARRVCVENPSKVLNGEEITPVYALNRGARSW